MTNVYLETCNRWAPAKPTIVFDSYWQFAAERQAIFFRRLRQMPVPWTGDPILQKFKFTNAYRVLDRVTQFLIRRVIYDGRQTSEEVFFRTILFKLFNKIETWNLLTAKLGELSWSSYSFDKYDKVLTSARREKKCIYSPAYIMPSGQEAFGFQRKHANHLKLVEMMMKDRVFAKIEKAKSMRDAFELLKEYPTIGDFLAYQFVIDINYSELTSFSEMDFVVPGPGARNGIRKCFSHLGGLNEVELIRRIADCQGEEFACREIVFESLFGRRLQLIDCQNLFCEVDKYARVAYPEVLGSMKRTRIKQVFRCNPEMICYWFPPKWGINQEIANLQRLTPRKCPLFGDGS